MSSRISKGFTLIEVLIALVIFAVVSVAMVRSATLSLSHAGAVQDRTVAWWLAENEMTELRMLPRTDDQFPSVGVSRDTIELGEIDWEVEVDVQSTENDFVRRVEIKVYREADDTPKAELIGFLGRY